MKIMGHSAPPALPNSYSPQLSRLLATCMARNAANRPMAMHLLKIPLVHQKASQHNLLGVMPQEAILHVQQQTAHRGGQPAPPPQPSPPPAVAAAAPPQAQPSQSHPPPPAHAHQRTSGGYGAPLRTGSSSASSSGCGPTGTAGGGGSILGSAVCGGVSRSVDSALGGDGTSPPLHPSAPPAPPPHSMISHHNRLPTPFQRQQHPMITARVQGAPYGQSPLQGGGGAASSFQQHPPPQHGLSIVIPAPATSSSASNGPAAAAPLPRRVASDSSCIHDALPHGHTDPVGQDSHPSALGPRPHRVASEPAPTASGYSPYGKSSGIGHVIMPNHHPHQLPRHHHSSTSAIIVGHSDRVAGLDRVREEGECGVSSGVIGGAGGCSGSASCSVGGSDGGGGGGPGSGSGGGGSGRSDGSDRCERSTASGVSWSIKPVCAQQQKRTAPMRKSWHALINSGASAAEEPSAAGGSAAPPPADHPLSPGRHPPPPSCGSFPWHQHQPGGTRPAIHGQPHERPPLHGQPQLPPQQASGRSSHGNVYKPVHAHPHHLHHAQLPGHATPASSALQVPSAQQQRRMSNEGCGGVGGGACGHGAQPPHTPPTSSGGRSSSLWAKRRGSHEISPTAYPENLQLVSLKGGQWEDLQSPLDAFARKHCPNRNSRHTSSSVASGDVSRLVIDTDDEACSSPSWDRSSNHSPLAALLRREFPGGKPPSERRLFEDL